MAGNTDRLTLSAGGCWLKLHRTVLMKTWKALPVLLVGICNLLRTGCSNQLCAARQADLQGRTGLLFPCAGLRGQPFDRYELKGGTGDRKPLVRCLECHIPALIEWLKLALEDDHPGI